MINERLMFLLLHFFASVSSFPISSFLISRIPSYLILRMREKDIGGQRSQDSADSKWKGSESTVARKVTFHLGRATWMVDGMAPLKNRERER